MGFKIIAFMLFSACVLPFVFVKKIPSKTIKKIKIGIKIIFNLTNPLVLLAIINMQKAQVIELPIYNGTLNSCSKYAPAPDIITTNDNPKNAVTIIFNVFVKIVFLIFNPEIKKSRYVFTSVLFAIVIVL